MRLGDVLRRKDKDVLLRLQEDRPKSLDEFLGPANFEAPKNFAWKKPSKDKVPANIQRAYERHKKKLLPRSDEKGKSVEKSL